MSSGSPWSVHRTEKAAAAQDGSFAAAAPEHIQFYQLIPLIAKRRCRRRRAYSCPAGFVRLIRTTAVQDGGDLRIGLARVTGASEKQIIFRRPKASFGKPCSPLYFFLPGC